MYIFVSRPRKCTLFFVIGHLKDEGGDIMTKEVLSAIQDAVGTQVFGIWFLIGAAFVFFMQAGFAMVEAGFTRAKNAGNIIMKNLMDFCIGTCVFIPLGFGILLGEDALGGFIGTPTLGIFTDYANFDWSNFVFNLVFCATTEPSYPEQWQNVPNSYLIVFIPQ